MSEKTSQKTKEEEMLDQTFGQYENEMTEQTQTEGAETVAPTAKKTEGKNSQNLLIFGLGGVAALGVLGYTFLKGGHNTAPQQAAPVLIQQNASAPQPPVQVAPPVMQNASAPMMGASGMDPAATMGASSPMDNASNGDQGNSLNGVNQQNPMAGGKQMVDNQPPVVVDQSNVAASAPDKTGQEKPPVVQDVKTNAVAPSGNAAQQALVDQLKQMFDQQTKEIQSSVEHVGNRVTDLEKSVNEQKNVNKSIEERLDSRKV